jgi:glycosyltransferase involved in cell wall biosynthesis
VDRATPQERLQQLAEILQKIAAAAAAATKQDEEAASCWNDDQQLITIMRGNVVLRRLASLAMHPSTVRDHGNNIASRIEASASASAVSLLPFRQQLVRIWPELLRLPPEQQDDADDPGQPYSFEVSLIIACFREKPSDVRLKLQHALNMARCPSKIQVVLVDAGGNDNNSNYTTSSDCGLQQVANEGTMRCNGSSSSSSFQNGTVRATTSSNGQDSNCSTTTATKTATKHHCWGSIKMVEFGERQQGRGPALNAGAAHSTGRILAFLHSDTKLPVDWDVKLQDTFRYDSDNKIDKADTICSGDNTSACRRRVRANAAAFGFGIDMNGLNTDHRRTTDDDSHDSYYPPGLRAVQMTANLRCRLWSLPYGDQCLCLPARIFHYVGGYPHQCFMEDYELIALLRRRTALVHNFFCITSESLSTTTTTAAPSLEPEALRIIPGPSALCSPRRWQRLGVLHVTYTNSRLVNLYHAHDLSPQDLYERYYGHALNDWHDLAPWEIQLKAHLRGELLQAGATNQQ